MSKYKPATFQPTVRPDWAGILSYMTDSEKSKILEAILKFPSMEIDSEFYNQTIKPDLTLQYETFKQVCLAKQRGVNNRWKIQKAQDSAEKTDKISITDVSDINNSSIRKDIDSEGEGEEEGKREGKEEIIRGSLKESNKLKESSSLQDEIEKSFEKFWSVYPKQRAGNKQKAFSAYKRAIKDGRATAEQINRVAEIYSVSDEVKRGYAKGAEAWLNDDRFNVDYSKTGKAEDGLTDFQRDVFASMNW